MKKMMFFTFVLLLMVPGLGNRSTAEAQGFSTPATKRVSRQSRAAAMACVCFQAEPCSSRKAVVSRERPWEAQKKAEVGTFKDFCSSLGNIPISVGVTVPLDLLKLQKSKNPGHRGSRWKGIRVWIFPMNLCSWQRF